eukprot:112232_1
MATLENDDAQTQKLQAQFTSDWKKKAFATFRFLMWLFDAILLIMAVIALNATSDGCCGVIAKDSATQYGECISTTAEIDGVTISSVQDIKVCTVNGQQCDRGSDGGDLFECQDFDFDSLCSETAIYDACSKTVKLGTDLWIVDFVAETLAIFVAIMIILQVKTFGDSCCVRSNKMLRNFKQILHLCGVPFWIYSFMFARATLGGVTRVNYVSSCGSIVSVYSITEKFTRVQQFAIGDIVLTSFIMIIDCMDCMDCCD